jgi:hypothetical protein
MNLEQELRHALARKEPSPGFDATVLTMIASGRAKQVPSPASKSTRILLPVAAALMLAFGGTYYLWEQHQRQVQTDRAAQELALALQITSAKLSAVQVKVQEIIRP